MDPSSLGLLIAYLILIAVSAFFSVTEMAYSSANRVRLRTLAAAGNKKAAAALKLLERYDRLLSCFLVGNNIANISLTAIGGMFFARVLTSGESLTVMISTIITTLAVLIFAEITPKMLAAEKPEDYCMALAPLVKASYYILMPVNLIFVVWRKLLKKVFKLKRHENVTPDELKTYVETAESGGEIDEHESKLIRSAIEFDDVDVVDIMTPRVNVVAVEENDSYAEIAELFRDHGYSRLPVYSKTIDSIIGIIHEKDLFLSDKNNFSLRAILQSGICLSKNMKISAALRALQKAKIHMAVVVDEYGGTSGIVTLEDIIEELVGEIYDEHDEVEILMRKIDDETFTVSGTEEVETMFEALGLEDDDEIESTSVGGFVTEFMEKIPCAGESFKYKNLLITVTKATVKRVVEIKVNVLPGFEEEEEDEKED